MVWRFGLGETVDVLEGRLGPLGSLARQTSAAESLRVPIQSWHPAWAW